MRYLIIAFLIFPMLSFAGETKKDEQKYLSIQGEPIMRSLDGYKIRMDSQYYMLTHEEMKAALQQFNDEKNGKRECH